MPIRSISLAIALSLLADVGGAAPNAPWCTINPAVTRQGQSDRLPDNKLHVVLAELQRDAKARLTNAAFVKITQGEAVRLTGLGAFADGDNYLVRASAFYVDANYSVRSQIRALYYLEDHALEVVNYSLSAPGTVPTNLAIVLNTDKDVRQVDIICRTAG